MKTLLNNDGVKSYQNAMFELGKLLGFKTQPALLDGVYIPKLVRNLTGLRITVKTTEH